MQRHDDLPAVPADRSNVAPRHADVDGAPELEPAAGEHQVSELIGATPAEARGSDEVADMSGRQRIGGLDARQLPVRDTAAHVERIDAGVDLSELVEHLLFVQPELARTREKTFQGRARGRIARAMDLVPELRESAYQLTSGAFGFAGKGHDEHQGQPEATDDEAERHARHFLRRRYQQPREKQ